MKQFLLPIFIFGMIVSCQTNDLQMYSGINAIQLDKVEDTLKRYTFYFEENNVESSEVFIKFRTTGYTGDKDREFVLRQVELKDKNNAIPNTHFILPEEQKIVVPAGSVYADIPVTLLRNELKDRTMYYIGLELFENANFKLGEQDKLKCEIAFTSALIRPNAWSDAIVKYNFGEWSFNKHKWMIDQTGHKWDDEFFEELTKEPGLKTFWTGKLNELLTIYMDNVGKLYDDNGVEITGFPN